MADEEPKTKQQQLTQLNSFSVLQLPEETDDEQPSQPQGHANTEIVEAKTAVILLDSTTVFKKNEYIHWRLTSMFKPMAIGEKTQSMEVLYLSHQRQHNWLSDYKNDDSNSIMMSAPSAPLSSTLFRGPLHKTSSSSHKKQKYLYVVTPRTNVITLTKICRLVFMVDLSSSLATVGNTKSQILLFEVFKTLRNSLEGIVHPFCLQISSNERIMIRPVLLLTVIADCSQFASNVNVIPMLVNHPSMRVFIQNVRITLENVDHVVSDLYQAFMLFQKDITIHRKQMKRKRSSMGYDLDVDEGPVPSYERSVFDATSLSSCMGVESHLKGSNDNDRYNTNTSASGSRKLKRKPKSLTSTPSSSSSSSVWGMGKTGANLTRLLHAGALALNLLPQRGRSQLILVTDGALKSHLHDNTVARQLAEQDVACHVIQIGFNQSFIPGRNFGFLPDVDTLKFLAQATGGTFLYSDECVRLSRPDHDPMNATDEEDHNEKVNGHHHYHHHYRFIQSSIMKKQEGSTIDDELEDINPAEERRGDRHRGSSNAKEKKRKPRGSPSPSSLEDDWWWNLDPNIYHRHLVLRESNLEKIRTLTPFHPRHFFNPRPAASSSTAPTADHDPSLSTSPTENDDQHQHHHHLRLQQGSSGILAMTNFPWDPEGTAPPIEWRLLRYREYALPDDFSSIIAARSREGFYLQSVLFDTKTISSPPIARSGNSSSSSDIHENKPSSKRKKGRSTPTHGEKSSPTTTSNEERIQITMVLHWKPHVIIEYRIRAIWLPTQQQQQQVTWGTLFSRSASPQVEVFIRCDAEFAHLLQNWQSLRRRAQMMMMMAMTKGPRAKRNQPLPPPPTTTVSNQLFFKGEPQAAQAYTTIEKLKTYLQCLFEGDDLLKEWLEPQNGYFSPRPFQQQQQQEAHVPDVHLLGAQFHSFWFSRFLTEESRALTRCWYDLDCIDVLVGNVSPYMDSKLASALNQEFGPHVQDTIQQSIVSVVKLLKSSWADLELIRKNGKQGLEKDKNEQQDGNMEGTDGLSPWFVKFLPENWMHGDDMDWSEFQAHPSFCLLKVKHEYGRLVTLRFLFFNANATIRQSVKTQAMMLLEENVSSTPSLSHNDLICIRPLSRLLIRDDDHFKPDDVLFSISSSASALSASEEEGSDMDQDRSKKQSAAVSSQNAKHLSTTQSPPSPNYPIRQQHYHQRKSSSWYLPIGLWLTGEHIVHDYLLHSIWSWQTDNYQDAYHHDNKMMPVHDLAFQLLCQARLDQGYQLVLPRQDNTHFYQEITFPRDAIYMKRNTHHHRGRKSDSLCAIQYFIRKDNANGKGRIITELWVEPSVHHINHHQEEEENEEPYAKKSTCQNDYDWIKTWTEIPDRRIISQLVTFDQIHAIGRAKGKGDFKPPTDNTSVKQFAQQDDEEEEEALECTNDATVKMLLPHLFDITSVLKTNHFVFAPYTIPRSMSWQPSSPSVVNDTRKKSTHRLIYSNADKTLLEHLDQLPCHYQTYCMVHYYFEQALKTNVMDGEVVMNQHSPQREFWIALKKTILQGCCDGRSNMNHISSLKQMKCYVSIIDPRSFLMVLVPSLKHVVMSFLESDSSDGRHRQKQEQRAAPAQFDCLLFECVRQKPLRASDTTSKEPMRKNKHHWLPSLLDDDEEEYKNMTIGMQPITTDPALPMLVPFSDFLPDTVYCGQFQHDTIPATLSEQSEKFLYKVTESYAQAFLRAIYSLLLKNALDEPSIVPVLPLSDLVKAMTICHTTVTNIDITRFVSIMACPSIALCEDMDHKWKMALDPYFKPIMISQSQYDAGLVTETADLLLYIPPFTADTSPSGSDIKTPPGQHPLFLGFNVTMGQTDDHMTTLCEEPTSFDQLKRTMVAFSEEKYEEEKTFFAKAFPDKESVDTASPRLTLNLICKSIAVDSKSRKQSSSSEEEKKVEKDRDSDALTTSYLTKEQMKILSETVSKIEWAFTEQVLHGLLVLQKKQQETNRNMLDYVVTQLGKTYIKANYQQETKFKVPLRFVSKDTSLCTDLFMNLFEKKDKVESDRVTRLDPYFHIIWSPLTLLAASSSSAAATTELADGSGLGISVEEQHIPDTYWLIVAVRQCQVEIYYFALSDQASPSTVVVDHTIRHIRKIEKQTNQTILLDMLQETRICSKYLEAPPLDARQGKKSNDSDSSHESESSGDMKSASEEGDLATKATGEEQNEQLVSSSSYYSRNQHAMHFVVGQFQCPLVYRKEFPLHWRVPLGKALHYLKNNVLRPFTVTNRTDMYVIERENSIVYCKLNEKPAPTTSGMTPLAKDETDTLPPSTPGSSSMASNELELLVYGLECPDWITYDVVTMIENRLMSEVTLDELQTFFTRNPTSKPTISDVRFILPFDKRSPQTEIFRVPHLVSNPSLLLGFFKCFLLAEDFKAFKGPTVVAAITDASSYHFAENNPSIQGDDNEGLEQSGGIALQKDDFCFYYNCTKRIPGVSSAFELVCGQGMAGVCMTLRDQHGKCMTTLPTKNAAALGFNFDPDAIRQSLETELRVLSIQSDQGYYHVWADIWTMGAVDDQVLLQRIHDDYRRALCDYFIEETVTIDLTSVLLYESTALQQAVSRDRARGFTPGTTPSHRQLSTLLRKKFINSIVYMLEKSIDWQNPTVYAMKESTKSEEKQWGMPPWCMKDIISHLDYELVQLDPSLEPTITWKKLGNQEMSTMKANVENDNADDDAMLGEWLLYRSGLVFCRNNIQNNIRVVAISGLCEFVEQFGGAAGSSPVTHYSLMQPVVAPPPPPLSNSHRSSSVQHRYLYHPRHPPYSHNPKRRPSLKSDPSRRSSASTEGNNGDSVLPSATSSVNINEQQQQQQSSRRVSYQTRSRGSSTSIPHPSTAGDDAPAATSIHPLSRTPGLVPRADPEKHCFLIMIMDVDRLALYAYNWAEHHSTRLFNSVFSIAHQQRMRAQVLNGILHQKMGLFHHSMPFDSVAQQYLASSSPTTAMSQEKSLTSPHHGGSENPVAVAMPTKTTTADDGSTTKTRPNLKKTKSELKVITHTTTTPTSAPTTPRQWTAADILIQHVISMNLPLMIKPGTIVSTPGSNTMKKNTRADGSGGSGGGGRMSISPSTSKRRQSQRRALSYGGNTTKLDPLSIANPALNYVLMDAIADPVNTLEHHIWKWKGMRPADDLLRWHGSPYLDTYLQHALSVSVHRKALQVYLKWRKRFGGHASTTTTPLASPLLKGGDDEDISGQDKLTRYEVSEILRSSRLLHFCRAPFFFFTAAQKPVTDENATLLLDWYRQYLRTFVVHYSCYLEKLNLQVVEFASDEYDQLPFLPSPLLNSASEQSRRLSHDSQGDHGNHDEDEDDDNDTTTTTSTIDDNSTTHPDLNTSKFDTGIHDLIVEHPSTYLLKVSDAGSIICEVRFTHMFVSVSLYGLHRQRGLFNFESMSRQELRETKRLHFTKFEQGVGQLKHLIHINSFVYDFHLYYIQSLLDLMYEQQQQQQMSPPPFGVSLMGALRRFHSFYATPTHYSTNRLFSGVYECNHHFDRDKKPYVDLSHFFKFLYKDHASYGLGAVTDHTTHGGPSSIRGVYLTSTCISFDDDRHMQEREAAWKYTLVLCPMTENTLDPTTLTQNPQESPASVTASSVLICYFILAVYQPERTPSALVKNFWSTTSSSSHPNLIVHARKMIDGIVSKVIKSCKQRFSWRALLPPTLKSSGAAQNQEDNALMDGNHWYPLVAKFQSYSLLHGEELNITRLINMLKKQHISWHKIFDLFLDMRRAQCRSFQYKNHRHILFYHPTHCMDALIHIVLLAEGESAIEVEDRMDIKLVRREPRASAADQLLPVLPLTVVEQEQVASLGQELCYILWKYAKN